MTRLKNMLHKGMIVAVMVALSFMVVSSASAATKKVFTGVVNINTASVAELTQLPGIGTAKAQAIVDRRSQAPFKQTSELMDVKGIGEKLFASLRDHVTVAGPSLTSAPTQGTAQPSAAGGAGR